jgi:hypothetical protein
MGSSITFRNIILVLFCFVFGTCAILQRGYTNQYGHYVPKRPNFKLKNKLGIFPKMLDTNNVYKLIERSTDGQKENSSNYINDIYLKFYPNGRYIRFSIKIKDSIGNFNTIKESDLNPETAKKSYFSSTDGESLQIESFVYGDGQGYYVISNYTISSSGDTLALVDKYSTEVYKRERIPLSWNKYKVNW